MFWYLIFVSLNYKFQSELFIMIFKEDQIFKNAYKPKRRHTKAVSDYQFLIQSMQRSKAKQHQYAAPIVKQSLNNQRHQKSMLSSYSHYHIRPSSKNQKLLNYNQNSRNLEIPNVKKLNDSDHQESGNYQMDFKREFDNKNYRVANIMIPNVQKLDSSKIPLFQSISSQEKNDQINIKKHMDGFQKRKNQQKQRYSLKESQQISKSTNENGARAASNLQQRPLENAHKYINCQQFIENIKAFLQLSSILFESCSEKGRLLRQARQISSKIKKDCEGFVKKQALTDYNQWVQQKQIKQQINKNVDTLVSFNNQDYLRIISQLQTQKQKLSQLISQHQRKNIKMYIQLNQGQSKEIQKYKKQLGSLYESYKKLQSMLLSKNKKNNDLMIFVEKIKAEFDKRCKKFKELKKQNEQLRFAMQSCSCLQGNVNDENQSINILKDTNKDLKQGKYKNVKKDTTKKNKNRSKDKSKQFNFNIMSTKHSQIDEKMITTNMQNKALLKQLNESKQKMKQLGLIINEQNAQLEKMLILLRENIQKENILKDKQLKLNRRIGQLQRKERQNNRKVQKMRKQYQQLFQQVQSNVFPLFQNKNARQTLSLCNNEQYQNLYRMLMTQADSIQQLLVEGKN